MNENIAGAEAFRSEAAQLRKTANDVQNIMSRLIALAGETAAAWQGPAANTLGSSQEYTIKEFAHFITLIEETADSIEKIADELEGASATP